MAPRMVIIGGGSYQWVPKLLIDVVNTPSLAATEVVLEDVDPRPLGPMADFVRHIAAVKGVPLTVTTTTDQRAALEGADYVVVTISTGGFESMAHDLEIPERHGIRQSVGDSVGPGGIMRALRNIPVLVGIARDMQELCADAWLLNITNPMTTLCRAVTRDTSVKTVGLCHEVAGAKYTLSQLLDADFRAVDVDIVGVNHLPLITALRVNGDDGFARLRELRDRRDLDETKRELLRTNRVKLALFDRFGVLPAAGDRHLVEFFPGFLTAESSWGKRWGVDLTTIADREVWVEYFKGEFARLQAATEVPAMPSGEIVVPMIDSFLRDRPRRFPVNLPNRGQAPGLPSGAVVETMCRVDGAGVHGDAQVPAPDVLTEWLRRVVAAQEATVDAALSGSKARALEAMMLDPLAGRMDLDELERMTDEMLAATARWLPQFV
jgi:alpha-galactosidase